MQHNTLWSPTCNLWYNISETFTLYCIVLLNTFIWSFKALQSPICDLWCCGNGLLLLLAPNPFIIAQFKSQHHYHFYHNVQSGILWWGWRSRFPAHEEVFPCIYDSVFPLCPHWILKVIMMRMEQHMIEVRYFQLSMMEEVISARPSLYSGCLYLWLPIYHTVMDTFVLYFKILNTWGVC